MTRPATKLSADERRAVERAREFLQAAAGPRTLAAYLDAGAVEDTALFTRPKDSARRSSSCGTCSPSLTSWPPRSRPVAQPGGTR